jgi:hypothetical protein
MYSRFETCWFYSEKKIKDVTGKLDSFKQEVNNKLTTVNKGN